MNKKIKASIVVMLIGIAWSVAVVILFWLLFLASTAEACDGVYLKIGTGYKFQETDEWTVQGVDHKIDDWSPYSARFELAAEKGRFTYGVAHHSQWETGFPFNDKKEYSKTEVFIDVKFDLWRF